MQILISSKTFYNCYKRIDKYLETQTPITGIRWTYDNKNISEISTKTFQRKKKKSVIYPKFKMLFIHKTCSFMENDWVINDNAINQIINHSPNRSLLWSSANLIATSRNIKRYARSNSYSTWNLSSNGGVLKKKKKKNYGLKSRSIPNAWNNFH